MRITKISIIYLTLLLSTLAHGKIANMDEFAIIAEKWGVVYGKQDLIDLSTVWLTDSWVPPFSEMIKIDFGPAGATLEADYLRDAGLPFGVRNEPNSGEGAFTFGWIDSGPASLPVSNVANMVADGLVGSIVDGQPVEGKDTTFAHNNPSAIWEIELVNGDYRVTFMSGDPNFANFTSDVQIENVFLADPDPQAVVGDIDSDGDHFDLYKNILCTVADGRLSIGVALSGFNVHHTWVTIEAETPKPRIMTQPVTEVAPGGEYRYQISATDPDSADVLTYALHVSPPGMVIDRDTGLITWTPSPSQVGGYWVSVRVTDLAGLFDTQNFLTIASSNATPPNVGWASHRDLTSATYSEKFAYYDDLGWMIKDFDTYEHDNGLRYSMIWESNVDNRGWAHWRDLTDAVYHDKWVQYKNAGYRPTDVEGYLSGSNMSYGGIWEQNIEGIGWSSHRDLTAQAYDDLFIERKADGYRLVDMEAYDTNNGLRYSCIWYENTNNISWYQWRDMSRTTYQDYADAYDDANYRMIDYESYKKNGVQKYAAIWEKNLYNHAIAVRTNRTKVQYANYWREYRDKGYRLIDFERYETSSGTRYGGIWTENSPRYRWSNKGVVDSLVTDYREDNNIPGISVAVLQDGEILYQRGFGIADSLGKKPHGKSVYNIASIAKAIGGTLAAKMELEGQLADGYNIDPLDLTLPTTNYLALPNGTHTHTVEQLFAHLGCIWHYATGPEPPNDYYATAQDAMETIWNTSTMSYCTPGVDPNYSTHTYTFAGAVLEAVSNRSVARLLEEELFDYFNLKSMKVQYRYENLRYNYERIMPYADVKDGGGETTYADNSWKVIGGGMESDAVDLVRFGWKVLDGQIVDPFTLEDRLWGIVNSTGNYGLGWRVKPKGGRTVAEKNGGSRGAKTHLRVYRDPEDQMVIAVLCNRRDDYTPEALVDDIGDALLLP